MAEEASPSWLTLRPDGLRCSIKVRPRAAKSGVQGIEQDADGRAWLAVRVNAPPDAGRANAEAIKVLAKRWAIAPRALRLVSGASSRHKVVALAGPADELAARLRAIEEPDGAPGGRGVGR